MTAPVIETRPGCPATRHDTDQAYRKHRCRCPQARKAEIARKAKYDRKRPDKTRTGELIAAIRPGVPNFHTDPRRNCATLTNPDRMFPDRAEHVPAAVRVCNGCPLLQPCDQWATEHRQVFGVWGGRTPTERRRQIALQLKAEKTS